MIFDIQAVQRDRWNNPVMPTDLVTSSRRRLADRCYELRKRKQQFRVTDQGGKILTQDEIDEMRRHDS